MAELTAARNNALPYPVYGLPFVVSFPLLDADGDPISPSSPDSEVSKNLDTFTDCTNEAVEIATSSGSCYLILTAAEMTADIVTVQIKSTGAKTTVLTLYPRKLVPLRSGTAQGGAAGNIILDAAAGTQNDIWNGCLCVATIDSNVEARIIDDYDGSNETASVTPDWNVTPDSDDTFIIYLPEGRQIPEANAVAVNSIPVTGTGRSPFIEAVLTGSPSATSLPFSSTGYDTGSSFIGWYVLVATGNRAGKVRRVTNSTHASSTFTLTIDTLGSAPATDDIILLLPPTLAAAVLGDVEGTVSGGVTTNLLAAAALAQFFTTDTGETFASAIAGSVIAELAVNSGISVADIFAHLVDGASFANITRLLYAVVNGHRIKVEDGTTTWDFTIYAADDTTVISTFSALKTTGGRGTQ